jgi:hypothetical protein
LDSELRRHGQPGAERAPELHSNRVRPEAESFYIALPYNDVTHGQFKPEAPLVIPWFKQSYTGPGQSVCRQSLDCHSQRESPLLRAMGGLRPVSHDHFQYVFGNERPKPNLNHGAGLDVSPAVRDYLGLAPTDVADWQFVKFGMCLRVPGEATAITIISSSRVAKASSVWLRRQRRGEEVAATHAVIQGTTAWAAVDSEVTAGKPSLLASRLEKMSEQQMERLSLPSSQRLRLRMRRHRCRHPSNSETVTNLKPLASSSSKVEGIASIVPG